MIRQRARRIVVFTRSDETRNVADHVLERVGVLLQIACAEYRFEHIVLAFKEEIHSSLVKKRDAQIFALIDEVFGIRAVIRNTKSMAVVTAIGASSFSASL